MRITPKVWENLTQVYAEDLLRGDLFFFPEKVKGFCQIKDIDDREIQIVSYDAGSAPKLIKVSLVADEYVIVSTPMIHIRDGEILKEYRDERAEIPR